MGYANDTFAQITREAWEQWQARYEPVLNELLGLVDSHQLMTDQLNRVAENEQNALNSARVGQSNDMARYGLASVTSPQDQTGSVNAALADATTRNGIRSAEEQRNLNILTGVGSKGSQAMLNTAAGGY